MSRRRRAFRCEACGTVVARRREHTEATCTPRLSLSESWGREQLQAKATRLAAALRPAGDDAA